MTRSPELPIRVVQLVLDVMEPVQGISQNSVRGLPSQVKGAGFRVQSRRSSRVRIPSPAYSRFIGLDRPGLARQMGYTLDDADI